MVKEFQLTDPVATVDSCAAELAGVNLAGLNYVTCQGHNNHNAVKAGLNTEQIKKIVDIQRQISTYFKKSSRARQILLDTQEAALTNLPDRTPADKPLLPIQDVQKTWSATYAALERLQKLEMSLRQTAMHPFVEKNKPELSKMIAGGEEKLIIKEVRYSIDLTFLDRDVFLDEVYLLSITNYFIVHYFIIIMFQTLSVLRPVAKVTGNLFSSSKVTSSLAIPAQRVINAAIAHKDTDSEAMTEMKTAMHSNFGKRSTLENPMLKLCSVLDPTVRHVITEDHADILLPRVLDQAQRNSSSSLHNSIPSASDSLTQPDPEPPRKKRRTSDDNFSSWITANLDDDPEDDLPISSTFTASARAKKEIDRYLQMPRPEKISVLDWWVQNKSAFPLLFEVARRYLSIQATSVSSERVWSTAGHFSNDQRHSITGDNLEALIFLNRNQIRK